MTHPKRIAVIVALLALAMIPLERNISIATAAGPYNYLPAPGSPFDGRMLSIDGTGLATLAGQTTDVEFSTSSGATSLEIGIFDGDAGKDGTGALNDAGGHWDIGTSDTVYTLYADPAGDGSGSSILIGQWTGDAANVLSGALWSTAQASMPDNDWWNVTVQTSAAAQAASGAYFYHLHVSIPDTTSTSSNAFKLRSSGAIGLDPDTSWGFIGAMAQYPQDFQVIYPQWDGVTVPPVGSNFWLTTATTYDGHWTFYLDVPAGQNALALWDGDFDHGTPSGVTGFPSGIAVQACSRTVNPNNPLMPPFTTSSSTLNYGSAGTQPGSPADDNRSDVYRRTPCVVWQITDPSGTVYSQANPSGNSEWSLFDISAASPLPAGLWRVDVSGLDLSNLSFYHFPYPVVGVCDANDTACTPLPVYGSIGDFVWNDLNGNGVQDAGEPGVGGVTVNLLNASGQVIATTTTDSNGKYEFTNLAAGTYAVQFVAPGGYAFTQYLQGGDTAKNSDANSASSGTSGPITLTVGQNDMTWDA
ncbi:MAG: carboxypeptidase regulatory-like domain-containing protein, partial [Chloroflexi bacterium]|nr:carboxypeptidase regulatory-like domain-containing protein [Chloroflexota bacterium]